MEYRTLHPDSITMGGSKQQDMENASHNAQDMDKNLPYSVKWKQLLEQSWLPIIFVLLFIIATLMLVDDYKKSNVLKIELTINSDDQHQYGDNNCIIRIVESIPEGLNFSDHSPKFMSTYDAWKTLLDIANESVQIGSLYWTLRGSDVVNHSTAIQGEDIFNGILADGVDRKLKIRIAQSKPTANNPNLDTALFEKVGAADVRSVDFARLLGNGVLHTKIWVVDGKHFYLGSANMDWRSLTQVKELGVLAQNCSCLAADVAKIFEEYWYLGLNTSSIPSQWPSEFSTKYNSDSPMIVNFNKTYTMAAFFASSPPKLTSQGRTDDLDAILKTISSAKSFVNIAVMDYFPLFIYSEKIKYWPLIDDALRVAAVENKVSIKMLISWWPHSRSSEDYFLKSLISLSSSFDGVNIQIKRFVVPSNEDQTKIPYSRVNHNKYMVTDNTAYIGTSNWSGDYFTNTAGIALVLRDNGTSSSITVRRDLLNIFQRDWESPYAINLNKTINNKNITN